MIKLLGRILNHDDAVEQAMLQVAYDETARAWKAHFGVPYSVCGCMMDPPAEKPVKGKPSLRRTLTSRSSRKKKTAEYSDLLSCSMGAIDSSHPSDHNIHRRSTTIGANQLVRIARQMASMERATRALESDNRNNLEEFRRLQAERRQTRSEHPEAFTEEGDGQYYTYWGVSAIVPYG
jgi:hypothetical protein